MPHGRKPSPDREAVARNRLLKNYRRHATRRSLVWELSDEAFVALLRGECFYCGMPPRQVWRVTPNKHRKTGASLTYNGIDRKDNAVGYTPDNAVTCCSTCNYAKRDLTSEAFLNHVRTIYVRHFGGVLSNGG
jgi:hypothetical protein